MTAWVRFGSIVCAALAVGGMFVIWVGYDPAALSPSAYVEQQQNAIRGLNVLMPALGAAAIALTLASAWLMRRNRSGCVLLIVAAAFLVISGAITRLGNQPINEQVMAWNPANPPATWTELRDQWWGFHRLRAASGLIALGLIVWVNVNYKGDRK